MEKEVKKERATAELAKEYDELMAKMDTIDENDTSDETGKVYDRLDELQSNYDWDNYAFTDPETGKKGVKDITGRILIPARYDKLTYLGSYLFHHTVPQAVMKDGLFGIVAADGSGRELSEFRFTTLVIDWFTGLYWATWGESKKLGMVTPHGDVYIPNVLTKTYEPWNDFMLLESDGKFGALDVSTLHFVLPTFDNVDASPDQDVVFYKDGAEGYVVEETGEFITKEQLEEDDQYVDAYVFNTNINI